MGLSRGSVHYILTQDLCACGECRPISFLHCFTMTMHWQNWQVHHDNAPSHSSHVIKNFLAQNNTTLVRQPSCSPDLVPCDFWLFPKLKITLKETRFQSRKNIMEKTTVELRSILEKKFKKCFQKWQRRWEKCVLKKI